MKTMKASEYRPLFIEAIRSSREDRWIPRSKEGRWASVSDCSLCEINDKFYVKNFWGGRNHESCPLYDAASGYHCSAGWKAWIGAVSPQEHIAAAKQVLAELDVIDVEGWIQVLVGRGALIDDTGAAEKGGSNEVADTEG